MSDPMAELASISSALDDLNARIGHLADRFTEQHREEVAHELFEVERSLTGGIRRLTRIVHR